MVVSLSVRSSKHHAPPRPFQERRTGQVLAAHQEPRKVAESACQRWRDVPHQDPNAVAFRARHVAPVAAECRNVELSGDEMIVGGKANSEAAPAVADPVEREAGMGARRPIEHARQIEDIPVAQTRPESNE